MPLHSLFGKKEEAAPKVSPSRGPAKIHWYLTNPSEDELTVDWSGESYRFAPGESVVKVRGNAKSPNVAKAEDVIGAVRSKYNLLKITARRKAEDTP